MNSSLLDQIARSILYEGYLLYPYRASAVKNRQRFNFGVISPQSYNLMHGGTEPCEMQCECLVEGEQPLVRIQFRFLHLRLRQIRKSALCEKSEPLPECSQCEDVEVLEVAGERYQTWHEAHERVVSIDDLPLKELCERCHETEFEFASNEEIESIVGPNQELAGYRIRTQNELFGLIAVTAHQVQPNVLRMRVHVMNRTPFAATPTVSRDEALMHSFVSAHFALEVQNGEFVSLLEPPDALAEEVKKCQQIGCFPVLVGENQDHHTMLGSPIILYDYPQVAKESVGDFFDGTEIDEMLMLRVMTMTPEEHREMRSLDEHARKLLERTQQLPPDSMMKLHGTVRSD